MRPVPVLFALACMLSGCDRSGPSVDALAADPVRLKTLRERCRAGQDDPELCARVAQADLRRFFSGQAGADEYRSMADLPAIPPSFDAPIDARGEGAP